MSTPTDGTVYIDAEQVRERYGNRSRMWLWRRSDDPTFPRPMKIGARNFYRLDDLLKWEAQNEKAS